MLKRKPVLIGLYSSAPQAGKSTASHLLSDALMARRGLKTSFRPFAAPLKLAAAAYLEALGLTDVEATRCVYERTDHAIAGLGTLTGRDVQCELGSYGREKVRPEIWVERNEARIVRDMHQGLAVIVDDVRMENEAESIMRLGGLMVKVSRTPLCDKAAPTATEGRLEMLPFSTILFNTGTLGDLENACMGFVGRLR